jgi:hypothetical protein
MALVSGDSEDRLGFHLEPLLEIVFVDKASSKTRREISAQTSATDDRSAQFRGGRETLPLDAQSLDKLLEAPAAVHECPHAI